MSNRRKHAKDGAGLGFARVALPALLLFGVGIGYLSLNTHCEDLGKEIAKARKEQAQLDRELRNEEHNWAQAKSVQNMEKLLEANGIQMTWPEERNIVRVKLHKSGGDLTLARAD